MDLGLNVYNEVMVIGFVSGILNVCFDGRDYHGGVCVHVIGIVNDVVNESMIGFLILIDDGTVYVSHGDVVNEILTLILKLILIWNYVRSYR